MPIRQPTMDGSQAPYVPGVANFYHIPPSAPPADRCKQLWQELEFALGERERGLWTREHQLRDRITRLEDRIRAVDAQHQEKWAQLDERSKALDLRETNLAKRERRYSLWRRNESGPWPQAGATWHSEREQMREVATATVCASVSGTGGVGEVEGVTLADHGNKEMVNLVGHPASNKQTQTLIAEMKPEPDQVCVTGEICMTSEAVCYGDKAQETCLAGPLKLENVGAVELLVEPHFAENVDTGVQSEEPKKLDVVTGGDGLDDVPLNVRRKILKGNKKRKPNEVKATERTEAVSTTNDQTQLPAQKVAKVQMKARDKHLNAGKQKVSVEVALQEDAPGLLESLRERGLADGLHLFGDVWENDLDPAMEGDVEFADLENVVSKVWSSSGLIHVQPPNSSSHSGLKSKPYCLGCLSTLVEQAKSMNRQNWPVEWGWCRQLHAFLFVFVKHNRIVLERPEYGYATYFFELVQTISSSWQIRRLVTVMSAASVGRAALMENKPLEVGDNLTQEEADILEGYGWSPNCGIASLLNFCDRVVHDYNKGDGDNMEWKVKIGKLLMDGHDRGSMHKDPPRRLLLTNKACSDVQPSNCTTVQPDNCYTVQPMPSTQIKVEVSADFGSG